MAFALSAAQTIAGIANSYECTGSGNLDDLATVFSTVGCTRTGNTLVFDSGGTSRIYAISGTLSDQRGGDYHVIVQNGAHVCWSYAAAASVTLGQYDATLGLPLSSVNINYRQNALATSYDQFQTASLVGKCALGLGIFNHDAGTFLYDQSGRADLDIPNTKATATTFNAVLLGTGANQTITHTHTNAYFVTTTRTRFKAPGAFEVNGNNLTTVQPISTTVGARILNIQTGTVRLLQQTANQLDSYLVGSAAVIRSVDPTSVYHAPQSTAFLGGIKQIMRTFKATSKTPLGVDIADSKLLVTPLTGGTTETITTFTSSATAEVLQSAVAHNVTYSSAGVGYTDTSSYKVSVLGFGYPSTPTTYDVKTNAGTAGIAVSAVLSKSSYVTSPYASVVTAPFSFSTTANGTLTIGSSATISQAAEYLFKIAYDNASAAFWVGLSHNPVVTTNGLADFGLISLSVSSGVALTGVAFKCATVTTAVALNSLTLTANVAQATPTNLTNLVLTGNLTFNTNSNVTITLTNTTISGTVSNSGTGTITVTLNNSTIGTIGTNVTTRLYAPLSLTSLTSGSSVYVADNTGTQKSLTTNSGTSFTYDATGGTGTWAWVNELYGKQRNTGTFTPTTGAATAALSYTTDAYITQTNAATVAAYTSIGTLDQWYDYEAYARTQTPQYSFASKSSNKIDFGSTNLSIDSGASTVRSYASSLITIKTSALSVGSIFAGIQTSGTVTTNIALNNLAVGANVIQATPTNLTNLNITGNLTFNTNSNITITLTGCTISGTISNTGTGTVTITNNGSTLGTIGTNVTSRTYAPFTLTGLLAGSTVAIYNASGVLQDINTNTGTSYAYDATGGTGTWYWFCEKYGKVRQTGTFTPVTGASTAAAAYSDDIYIQAALATVSAYATLDDPNKMYDYIAYWRTTAAGVAVNKTFKDGSVLRFGNADVYFSSTASVPLAYDSATNKFTIKTTGIVAGSVITSFATTGTVTSGGPNIGIIYTDVSGTRVSLTNRNSVLMTSYVLVNGVPTGGDVTTPGFVPLASSRILTVQPTDAVRIVVGAYGYKNQVINTTGSNLDAFTVSLEVDPGVDTTVSTATRTAISDATGFVQATATVVHLTFNQTLASYLPAEVVSGISYAFASKGFLAYAGMAAANTSSLYSVGSGSLIVYSPNFKVRMADLDANGAAIGHVDLAYSIPLVMYYLDTTTGTQYSLTKLNASGACIATAPWTKLAAEITNADKAAIVGETAAEVWQYETRTINKALFT